MTEKKRQYRNRWNDNRRNDIRDLIRAVKDQPCADCGQEFPFFVMDFDHVRGKKKLCVAQMRGQTLDEVISEIMKCDVVCSNCHRIRSWGRYHQADLK